MLEYLLILFSLLIGIISKIIVIKRIYYFLHKKRQSPIHLATVPQGSYLLFTSTILPSICRINGFKFLYIVS